MAGRFELHPQPGIAYIAFIDPSGGSADAMTLAIAHRDRIGHPVLDCLREVKPPFSPEQVCQQFATELKRYDIRKAYADRFGGEWVTEAFSKVAITIESSPLTRSELYLELLPLVNSGSCELLDHPRLINQLAALERRVGRSGRDAVDHPRGAHDDLANSAAGALVMVARTVGLLASLPSDFVECVNPVAMNRCGFFFSSPWLPNDAHCRRECSGHRAVREPYMQERQRAAAAGESIPSARQFLDARFDPSTSPLTNRGAWAKLRRDMADMMGL